MEAGRCVEARKPAPSCDVMLQMCMDAKGLVIRSEGVSGKVMGLTKGLSQSRPTLPAHDVTFRAS